MSTDRLNAPKLTELDKIALVKPAVFDVSKQVKLFWMKDVPNETSRLELHFDAGSRKGTNGIPGIVHNLLLSGTEEFSSTEIHEQIDQYGAYIDTTLNDENASISIYALKDHLIDAAKVIENAIQKLSFREDEVRDTLNQMKSSLKVNLEKVGTICQRKVKSLLFQELDGYNTVSELVFYEQQEIKQYRKFLQENFHKGLINITVVGDLPQDSIDEIIDLFGKWSKEDAPVYPKNFQTKAQQVHIEKDDALQSAIRLVKPLFNKTHPEYTKMQVLITILGDYFGSRLMTNIREDKGYTYGIGAFNPELIHTGYFVISTEVGKEVRKETLKEIQFELKRLQTEVIPEEELELVKNYMLGQTLKAANGPYAMLDLYQSVYLREMDLDFYDKSIEELKNVTAQDLMELAIKEFKWEDFIIVTVG